MFAVWRAAHHVPIYSDPTKPPYASAYFNWLFYTLYGAIARLFDDTSLPRVGRLLTTAFAVIGAITTGWIGFRSARGTALRLAGLAIGVFLFFGPMVGWWAVTIRPDTGALFAETLGIILFLALHRAHPTLAVWISVCMFYIAWAFKPTYLGGLCAVAAFLLVHRRWRDLATLAGGSVIFWSISLAVGGSAYRASLLETATTHSNKFLLPLGLTNLLYAGYYLVPLIVLLPWWGQALLRSKPWKERSLAHDALLLSALALPVVTALLFYAACKFGASPNYFFPTATLLTIGTLQGVFPLQRNPIMPATLACALILILECGILTGLFGKLSLDPYAERLSSCWSVYKNLPEPRFAYDYKLDLPWLNPHSPHILLPFNYERDRAAGRVFVGDGVGGMITRGEFASLMLPASLVKYDGAALNGYERGETVEDMVVLRRRPPPPGDP